MAVWCFREGEVGDWKSGSDEKLELVMKVVVLASPYFTLTLHESILASLWLLNKDKLIYNCSLQNWSQ